MEQVKSYVRQLTEIGMSLIAFAIIASVLVGKDKMSFLGDVVGNITGLVAQLGSAGLAGLISLGLVVWLIQNK
jgi:hypothetical protein